MSLKRFTSSQIPPRTIVKSNTKYNIRNTKSEVAPSPQPSPPGRGSMLAFHSPLSAFYSCPSELSTNSALDSTHGHALDECSLREEEQDDDRYGYNRRNRHKHAVFAAVLTGEHGKAERERIF